LKPAPGSVEGFLTIAKQYARLGFDQINVMPPVDERDAVGFASRLAEQVIPSVAQMDVGVNSPR
jgi:hypothetical protein